MKAFKTKLVGARRTEVVAQGRAAAKNGWERRSPYTGCRAEEAWYDGFDNPLDGLMHCTESACGRVFSKGDKCPTCASRNIRPNVVEGTVIMMTVSNPVLENKSTSVTCEGVKA